MGRRAASNAVLAALVRRSVPLFRQAERDCPRLGPGAKPWIPDWLMAILIMVAILAKKKSKSAQYRYLDGRRAALAEWLGASAFPSRATYFRRYRRAHQIYRAAIRRQGEQAIAEGIAHPRHVAVDKSLLDGLGPPWHKSDRQTGKTPAGVDRDATWGYSEYDGWVHGYSYEVVVTATPGGVVFPLLASVDVASASEQRTFADKVPDLPGEAQSVSADSGYDANSVGEAVEYDPETGRRSGRRFLCPENPRNNKRPKTKGGGADEARARGRRRRRQRAAFLTSDRGRRIYARRKKTVEPFNQWFKGMFELDGRVWHRGLDNNRTQVLAAIFAYQLLVRHNHRCGNKNGCVRWILDKL